MKRMLAVMMAVAGMASSAAPTVSNETAKQRFPWNGLVDITCTVSGINGTTNGLTFAVVAVMPDSGTAREVPHFWVVRNGMNSTDYAVNTNGDYRLVWDAQADLGPVRYSNMVVRVVVVNNKVRLWEGGPYWATTNIGADEPWEYGYYFWWGDTVGYKYENDAWVASDGSPSVFSFDDAHSPTYNKSLSDLQGEGWITADGVLALEHDAAHVQWGGNWRMPTKLEQYNLNSICDWTWTRINGVNGYVVRGRGTYASASIFLPLAGYGNGTSLLQAGSHGYYWSSVPISDNNGYDGYVRSWFSYFYSGYIGTDGANRYYGTEGSNRYYGYPIRPVQGFTE